MCITLSVCATLSMCVALNPCVAPTGGLRKDDADKISGDDPTGGQRLAVVRQQLRAIQGQTEVCFCAEMQTGSKVSEGCDDITAIKLVLACGTDLRPCEVSTVSRTTWMSSVRLGSSPWSSILLVCRRTRTRSLMLWSTRACNISTGFPACAKAPAIQRGGGGFHCCCPNVHSIIRFL